MHEQLFNVFVPKTNWKERKKSRIILLKVSRMKYFYELRIKDGNFGDGYIYLFSV